MNQCKSPQHSQVRARFFGAITVILTAMMAVTLTAQESNQSDGFTADQASRGGEVYERECAACHRSDFQGSFAAPQ